MSMSPYGGFTFTFATEQEAKEAISIIQNELNQSRGVWGECVEQKGNTVFVDDETDLTDEYDEETDDMRYKNDAESMLNISKKIITKYPDITFQLDANIADDEGYWQDETACKDSEKFSFRRVVQINGLIICEIEEILDDMGIDDLDLDEYDPEDCYALKITSEVTGAFKDGKWNFQLERKTTLE